MVTKACIRSSERFALIDKIYLSPQVDKPFRCWRTGEKHHTVDAVIHSSQGLEPLRLMILEATRLIDDDHIEWPGVLIIVGQPYDVVSIDDVDVGIRL